MDYTEKIRWILKSLLDETKEIIAYNWYSESQVSQLKGKVEGLELALDYINGRRDRDAEQIWVLIPVKKRELILANIFCKNCGFATVKEYTIINADGGIKLGGKCETCSCFVEQYVQLMKTKKDYYKSIHHEKLKQLTSSDIEDICA